MPHRCLNFAGSGRRWNTTVNTNDDEHYDWGEEERSHHDARGRDDEEVEEDDEQKTWYVDFSSSFSLYLFATAMYVFAINQWISYCLKMLIWFSIL